MANDTFSKPKLVVTTDDVASKIAAKISNMTEEEAQKLLLKLGSHLG